MKKGIKKILCAAMSLSMMVFMAGTFKATSIDDEQKKQEDLKKNIESAQQILTELEQLKTDTENYIIQMDAKMSELTNYIIDLNRQIEDKQGSIDEINVELDKQQKSINEQYDAMKLRIRFMYENGNKEYLDMLLTSKGVEDMLNRAEYLGEITKYDRDMLDKLKKTKEAIDATKKKLESEQKELENLKSSALEEQAQVQVLVDSKAQLLAQTDQQISDTQNNVDTMEGQLMASEQMENELVMQEQALAIFNGSGSNYYDGVIQYTGEKFRWPLKGYYTLSSGFSHRINQVTGQPENHSGLDIPAPAGTPVTAAMGGTVAWANRSSSAGNWVGIDHGNGLVTVYMHMSAFNCKAGDVVNVGDTIGYVGSTGQSTGNHLHFSVRLNGAYVNPIYYLG